MAERVELDRAPASSPRRRGAPARITFSFVPPGMNWALLGCLAGVALMLVPTARSASSFRGPEMSLGRYLLGVAALLCVLGSVGVGAAAVRRYLLPDWRGAYARLAEIVTGCALLVGIMEVLGTVGLFRLVPVVVGSIAVGCGAETRADVALQCAGRPPRRRPAGGYRRRPHPHIGGRSGRRAAPVDRTEPPVIRERDHRR